MTFETKKYVKNFSTVSNKPLGHHQEISRMSRRRLPFSTSLQWSYADNKIKSIDFNNARIIFRQNNSYKTAVRESFVIVTIQNDVCKNKLFISIPNIWINLLKHIWPPFFFLFPILRNFYLLPLFFFLLQHIAPVVRISPSLSYLISFTCYPSHFFPSICV